LTARYLRIEDGGSTAVAVVLPKAMAYATVAGLPVAVGLCTAFIPMLVHALLGTSPVLSVSSTTTLAAVVILYSAGLIQLREFRDIRRVRTLEFRWAVVACAGVLRPLSPEHRDAETVDGLLIVRPEG
jgi:MFS superfamily sulfate permease-like transporter